MVDNLGTQKISTMVGENFEIYMFQMAKNAPKLSTMIGENFGIYLSLKWLKNNPNCLTWLEKILKQTKNKIVLERKSVIG